MALNITNVNRLNIVKLGGFLSNQVRIDCLNTFSAPYFSHSCKIELFDLRQNPSTPQIRKNNHYRNFNIRFITYDHENQDKGPESQDGPNESSSYFHQRFHRQSYERKRSTYQEYKDSQKNSSDSREPTSNPLLNHYQRLNIDSEADLKTIKSAYYSLSKLYHPDIVGTNDPEAAENFRLITESYDTLSDSRLRSQYDQEMNLNSSSICDVSFSNAMHPNKDFNPLYNTRDADVVFRSRQEAAFQREKMLNPKKFRAGTFKKDLTDNDESSTLYELEKLEKRIEAINRMSRNIKKSNEDDFYQMHLLDTIQRKHYDVSLNERYTKHFTRMNWSSNSSLNQDTMDIISTLSIILLILFVIINFSFDIDLGTYLDNQLNDALKTAAEESDRNEDDVTRTN